MKIDKMKDDIKQLLIIELDFLIKQGFIISYPHWESSIDGSINEYMELSNSFMKLDINYDKFVDSKQVTVHFCKKNNDSSFSFRQYLAYKKRDKEDVVGSLDQSDEQYIKYFFKLLK